MIELSDQQVVALENSAGVPPRVVNARSNETYVLLRVEEYERLRQEGYDDSSWTREELQALAWERVKNEDWDEYDSLPEKPSSAATLSSFAFHTLPVSGERSGPRS